MSNKNTWSQMKKALLKGAYKTSGKQLVPDNKVWIQDWWCDTACSHYRGVVSEQENRILGHIDQYFMDIPNGNFGEQYGYSDRYFTSRSLEGAFVVPETIGEYKGVETVENTDKKTNWEHFLSDHYLKMSPKTKPFLVDKRSRKDKGEVLDNVIGEKHYDIYLVDKKWGEKVPETFEVFQYKYKPNENGRPSIWRTGGWHPDRYYELLEAARHGIDYIFAVGHYSGGLEEMVEQMEHYANKGRLVLRLPEQWEAYKLKIQTNKHVGYAGSPFWLTDTEANWGVNGDKQWEKVEQEIKDWNAEKEKRLQGKAA